MMTSLDIIIVNWNAGNLLLNCLHSIETVDQNNFNLNRIVVVDNASSDGSIDHLDDLNLPLIIIHNAENRGFGAACNQGAADSQADYLLFLNPDTRLSSDTLDQTVSCMNSEERQAIGIMGIQLVDQDGIVMRSCSRLVSPLHLLNDILGLSALLPRHFGGLHLKDWDHRHSRPIGQVIGAFYFVRGALFKELRGFDERFFVYFEDLDFAFRASQSGWQSYYLADVQAFHEGGGTSQQVKAHRLAYLLHSRILYSYKHFSWLSATLVTLATLFIEPLTRLIFLLVVRRSSGEAIQMLKGYQILWSRLIR